MRTPPKRKGPQFVETGLNTGPSARFHVNLGEGEVMGSVDCFESCCLLSFGFMGLGLMELGT